MKGKITREELEHSLVTDLENINSQLDNVMLQGKIIKSNGIDDTINIQNALDLKGKIILNDDYIISSNLIVHSDTIIDGNGTIKRKDNSVVNDMFLINEPNAKNILIKNIKIFNGSRFGIQVFGTDVDNNSKPNNIIIENIYTENCSQGGIFLASCNNIRVSNCINKGGVRHIGTFAPINNPECTHDITIENNKTEKTSSFGYQTYYGKDILISNNIADGTLALNGDKSCITVDRSKNVTVIGNLCTNARKNNIFVTGTTSCSVVGNTCIGSIEHNIQVMYNTEYNEDSTIKEANFTTLSSNVITGNGIIINSAKNTVISNNVINSITAPIFIMEQTRTGDDLKMKTTNLIVSNNICTGSIERRPTSDGITFIDNICSSYNGLTNKDLVIDKKLMRFAGLQLEDIGNIKRVNMSDDFRILEYNLANSSAQKGMIQAYQYGAWRIYDSNNENRFAFFVGTSGNSGDFEVNTKGKGIILKSPNGNIRKRIIINDSGELAVQTL